MGHRPEVVPSRPIHSSLKGLSRRGGAGFRGQLRIDQGFHLAPYLWIALNLGVSFYQEPVEPGISVAANGIGFVVEPEISQDFRPLRVCGANLGPAVHDSVGLIKIYRLSYIGRDYLVILADLGDAIHLNGEQDGDAVFFQLSRQRYSLRSAPAMSKDDDAGILFLFGR